MSTDVTSHQGETIHEEEFDDLRKDRYFEREGGVLVRKWQYGEVNYYWRPHPIDTLGAAATKNSV